MSLLTTQVDPNQLPIYVRVAILISVVIGCFGMCSMYAEASVTVSGTLYENNGTTPITSTATVTVAVSTSTPSLYSTTTDGSGNFSLELTTATSTTPLTLFVDNSATTSATTLTFLNGSTTVSGIDLWADTVRMQHSSSTGDINLASSTFYDASEDGDVLFDVAGATTTIGSSTALADLYIATSTTFTPTSELEIYGGLSQQGQWRVESATTTFKGVGGVATGTLSGENSLGTMVLDTMSDGSVWVSNEDGEDGAWADFAYGNGLFVAVGPTQSGLSPVMTSTDGISWSTTTAAGDDDTWTSVTYGDGTFVAVANCFSSGDCVMTSSDGLTWSTTTAAVDNGRWRSVTYGNSLFVAVGESGTERVMTSPDGINWTARSAAGNNDQWKEVIYGDGLFVAVTGGGGDRLMTSPDGITWTVRATPGITGSWESVTYGEGLFVAVGNVFGTDRVMTSPDGITWTARSAAGDNDYWRSVTYGNGIFVAVGHGNSNGDAIMTSPDGITWIAQLPAVTNAQWTALGYGNGVFVAEGNAIPSLMTSSGGTLTITSASSSEVVISADNELEIANTLTVTDRILNNYSIDNQGVITFTGPTTIVEHATSATPVLGTVNVSGITEFVSSATTSDLTIIDGGDLTLADALESTGSITVDSGGSLTASTTIAVAGDFTQNGTSDFSGSTLFLEGDFTQNGTSDFSGSTVTVNGVDVQTLSGEFTGANALNDLSIDKKMPWTNRTAAGNNDSWEAVTYEEGLFVAVSRWPSFDKVVTSPDGITWTARSAAGNNDNWRDVTHGTGTFVAVADCTTSFTGDDCVMTSPDGITWTARSAAGDNDGWQSVTYGNGLFVAVGSFGDTVMTSPDGITWTVRATPGITGSWQSVTYGNGLFVAVGSFGDPVMTSPDGITWTARSAAGDNDIWTSVTYGNGLFVAVGQSVSDRVMTSSDGLTWTARSAAGDDDNWQSVTYGNGLFVAVGAAGSIEDPVMTSPDGITWTARLGLADGNNWQDITYDDGLFVAVADFNNRVMTHSSFADTNLLSNATLRDLTIGPASPFTTNSAVTLTGNYTNEGDFTASTSEVVFAGTTMQTATGTLSASSSFYDLTVSNTSQNGSTTQSVIWGVPLEVTNTYTMLPGTSAAFLAGATSTLQNIDLQGTEGNEIYLRSLLTGTATWTAQTAAADDDVWADITYANGTYVAVGGLSANDRVMTSSDGVTWSTTTAAGDNDTWEGVTYGNGLFVAVSSGSSGASDNVMTSPDGVTWTARSAADDNDRWDDVVYGDGTFVAVGSLQDRVMYSSDGINWSTTTAAGDDDLWRSVTYGNGLFVAVANDGTDRVMTSPDGITWTARSAAGNNDDWRSVTYGNGLFVAVADEDSASRDNVMTSPDGINWTVRSAAGNNDLWRSVSYGNGLFVAVGRGDSSYDPVMTSPDGINWTARDDAGTDDRWSAVTYGDGKFVVVSESGSGSSVMTYSESWGLEVPGSQISVEFLDVRDSHASSTITAMSSIDSGNNVNWTFIDPNAVNGSSTIADHDAGQVNDAFNFMNRTNEPLFAFNLTPESGNATVTELTLSLTGVEDVDPADFSNIRLLRDLDNDAEYDGSDEAVGGAGVLTINTEDEDGTIVFSEAFAISTTTVQNYIVVANWNVPERGAIMNVLLRQSGVVAEDDEGPQDIFGSVRDIQHSRTARRGGGGSSSDDIGGAPPAGDDVVEGGTEDGGEQIGNDPNFRRPTAHAGSWNNAQNAYDGVDGTYTTTDAATSSDWRDHAFAINTGNTIQGVEVKLELNSLLAGETVDVQLSWDGGTSWTAVKTSPALTSSDTVISLGGPSDLWGRSWSVAEFSDANFRVRLTAAVTDDNSVRVDEIQVRVYNQTGGGGSGGGADI